MDDIETVLEFLNRINQRDVDKLAELMTEDHVFVDSLGNQVRGREKMRGGAGESGGRGPPCRAGKRARCEDQGGPAGGEPGRWFWRGAGCAQPGVQAIAPSRLTGTVRSGYRPAGQAHDACTMLAPPTAQRPPDPAAEAPDR